MNEVEENFSDENFRRKKIQQLINYVNTDLLDEEKRFVMANMMLKSVEIESMILKLNQENNQHERSNVIDENLIMEKRHYKDLMDEDKKIFPIIIPMEDFLITFNL
jgi:hypothetical protein